MKLKSTLLLGSFLATIVGLNSCNSCNNNNSDIKNVSKLDTVLNVYNDKNFIENTNDSIVLTGNNQVFIDWSWQKFLWLTSYDANNAPVYMNELKQVTDFGKEITKDDLISKGLDTLYINNNKLPLVLDLYKQADGTVLEGNKNSVVRYSIHANDGILNIIKSKATEDIINQALEILKTNDSIRNNVNTPLGNTVNNSIRDTANRYPIGATEIKIAWINTTDVIDSNKTFNVTAIVNESKDLYQKYNSAKLQRMSMIGFHIFTVTAEHPEGIWSTFDQRELAPNRISFHGVPVNTETDYTFFKEFTNIEDGITKADVGPRVKNKVFQSYPEGVRYDTSSKGMDVLEEDKDMADQIKSSNEKVQEYLKNDKVKIWTNYKLVGSIWSKTNAPIAELLDGDLTAPYDSSSKNNGKSFGSFNSANVTLETTFQIVGKNCFTCHSMSNTLFKFRDKTDTLVEKINIKSPLITSHLFEKYVENEVSTKRYEQEKYKNNKHKNNASILTIDDRNNIEDYIRRMSRLEANSLK